MANSPTTPILRSDSPRDNIQAVLLLFTSVVTLALIVFMAANWAKSYGQWIRDAYLAEQTSLLIVRYIDARGDQLPRDWRDLESVYPGSPAEAEGFSFEEMRDRVQVEFEDMASNEARHRIFIFSDASLNSPDPNERVRNRVEQIGHEATEQD
jgi:hypothetical protein